MAGNWLNNDPEIMQIIPLISIHFSLLKENLAIRIMAAPVKLNKNGK
jgi:hypothetical protein